MFIGEDGGDVPEVVVDVDRDDGLGRDGDDWPVEDYGDVGTELRRVVVREQRIRCGERRDGVADDVEHVAVGDETRGGRHDGRAQHVCRGEPLDSRDANVEVGHDVGEADVEERFIKRSDKRSKRRRKHNGQRPIFCSLSCRGWRRSHEASLSRADRNGFGGVSRFTRGYPGSGAAQRVSYSRRGQGCSRFSVLVGVDFKVASKTIPNCRVKVFQNDE